MTEAFDEGDSFANVAGPLGNPTHIGIPGKPADFRGTVACVAGGIGAAPMLPIVRAFREAGHEVVTILGARRRDLLVFEDRLGAVSNELLVCTDDGSHGRKGFVTDVLKAAIESRRHAEAARAPRDRDRAAADDEVLLEDDGALRSRRWSA